MWYEYSHTVEPSREIVCGIDTATPSEQDSYTGDPMTSDGKMDHAAQSNHSDGESRSLEKIFAYLLKLCGLAYGALHSWTYALKQHLEECFQLLKTIESFVSVEKTTELVAQCEALFQNTYVFTSDFLKTLPTTKQKLSVPKKERLFLEVYSLCLNQFMAEACLSAAIKDQYKELEARSVTGFDKKLELAQYFSLQQTAVRDAPQCELVFIREMYKIVVGAKPEKMFIYENPEITVNRFGYPSTEQSKEKKAFISQIVNASYGIKDSQNESNVTQDVLKNSLLTVFGGDAPDVNENAYSTASAEKHAAGSFSRVSIAGSGQASQHPKPIQTYLRADTGQDHDNEQRSASPEDQNGSNSMSTEPTITVEDSNRQSDQADDDGASSHSLLSEILAEMDKTLGCFRECTHLACSDEKVVDSGPEALPVTENKMSRKQLARGLEFIESALSRQTQPASLLDFKKVFTTFGQIIDVIVHSEDVVPKSEITWVEGQFALDQQSSMEIREGIHMVGAMLDRLLRFAVKTENTFYNIMKLSYQDCELIELVWSYLCGKDDAMHLFVGLRCVFFDFMDSASQELAGSPIRHSYHASSELRIMELFTAVLSLLDKSAEVLKKYLLPSVVADQQNFVLLLRDLQT